MKKLLLFLILTGCSKFSGPYRDCLSGHTETYTQMTMAGKVMIPVTHARWVCDTYSVEEYININDVKYKIIQVSKGK